MTKAQPTRTFQPGDRVRDTRQPHWRGGGYGVVLRIDEFGLVTVRFGVNGTIGVRRPAHLELVAETL